jgi:type II secretory pathway component GspD/PulD (secretin)
VGYAFGTRSKSLQDTELLIVITPRILRLADHLTRTIFAGRGDIGGGRAAVGPGIREIPQPQPQQQPPPTPQQQPQSQQR